MKPNPQLPPFPELKSDEYAYALGYLESSIRNLHDNLVCLSSYVGLCEDLREIPLRLAKRIEERRAEPS